MEIMRNRLQILMLIAGIAIIGCNKQAQPGKTNNSGNTFLTTDQPEADRGKGDTTPPVDSRDTPPPPKPLPPQGYNGTPATICRWAL